jgi:hypothetical protein
MQHAEMHPLYTDMHPLGTQQQAHAVVCTSSKASHASHLIIQACALRLHAVATQLALSAAHSQCIQ